MTDKALKIAILVMINVRSSSQSGTLLSRVVLLGSYGYDKEFPIAWFVSCYNDVDC